MCDIRVCISWPEKSQDACRTSRPIPVGWSRCAIFGCVFLGQKNHKMRIALLHLEYSDSNISTDDERLVDVRYSVLYFLARKSTRCVSYISTDPGRLVDVRYSVLYLCLPNEDFRNRNSRPACVFEGLCDGSSPTSSTHTLAKSLENTRPTRCSVFQNLRLGSIVSLGQENHKMRIALLAHVGKQHLREIATPDLVRTLRQ